MTNLKSIVDSLEEIKVTNHFISYRDECVELFNKDASDDRSLKQRMMHADCTLLEYTLIMRGLVQAPYNRVHDFCLQDKKIDVKCISEKSYTPKTKNIKWMREALEQGDLTHFGFYRMYGPSRPLEEADTVSFDYIKTVSAKTVLNNLKPSKFKEGTYYFWVGE